MDEPININSATAEELTSLPGVGSAMADRLMAARPFESVDDLRQIRGIGPTLLDRLTPLITLTDPVPIDEIILLEADTEILSEVDDAHLETDSPPGTDLKSFVLEDELIPEWDGSESEKAVTIPEIPMPREKAIVPVESHEEEEEQKSDVKKPITWSQILMLVGASSLASFILAVLLSLGILSTLNGGLRFGSIEDMSTLSSQADTLEMQLITIGEDIASLRTRLDNLEGITSRVNNLESLTGEIETEIALTADLVDDMNIKIEEILDNTTTFQLFLDGLSELVETLDLNKEAP